jgi:hypothetical protein
MSKDTPQPHHRPQPGTQLDVKAVPVAVMHFKDMLDIPGRLQSQGLKSESDQPNRHNWRIHYLPQLRHFQLEFRPANSNSSASASTYFVHETHVIWWTPAA